MRRKLVVLALLLFGVGAVATQKLTPPDVKTGRWEVTTNTTRTGQMPMSPELMARMTPEQRAKMEERMKANAGFRTQTRKECMAKEKLEKNSVFDDEARQCKRTVVTSGEAGWR